MEIVKISEVKVNPNNPRIIKDDKFKKLVQSIKDFPEMLNIRPIVVNKDMIILGGNMRYKACKEAGLKEIPIIIADFTEEQQREFLIKDNTSGGEWDWEVLANEWDSEQLEEWGLDLPDFGDEKIKEQNKKLSDRFIIPPFSVLDTKQGAWQQRKNYWLSLGIKSEEGRDAQSNAKSSTFKNSAQSKNENLSKGTSIFDPVLCELSYKWFNVENGTILDCFAGGSVRGIIASKLGYVYYGNDLRKEQIEANIKNAKEVLKEEEIFPNWSIGDSLNINDLTNNVEADMIFSCPPYADLEVYSDLKEDISNMDYKDFMNIYREIIKNSCKQLKKDRFAVFAVGDIRDKKGFYQNFVSDTIKAFLDAGLLLYNEMILLTPIGTVAMQTSRNFPLGRKVGKVHQNVLVFYKGDPTKIKANYPELDLSYINDELTEYHER